jgi:hypothetical protein
MNFGTLNKFPEIQNEKQNWKKKKRCTTLGCYSAHVSTPLAQPMRREVAAGSSTSDMLETHRRRGCGEAG